MPLVPAVVAALPLPDSLDNALDAVIPLSTRDLFLETVQNNLVIVHTDGACSHQSIPYLCRAGFGVVYDKSRLHSRTVSQFLPGPEQSAQRAEVRAVLAALQVENRPLHIFSASS